MLPRDMLHAVHQMTAAIARQARMIELKRYLSGERKTIGVFARQIWSAIRDLHNGGDEFAFIDDMTSIIENQLNRAWRQGARDMNVDPADFEQEDYDHINAIIQNEYEYIPGLAQDIIDARDAGNPIDPFRARADLWTNRYNEVVNEAHVWFGGKTRLKWVMGPTEEHCASCSALNGIVAWAREWEQAKIRPQQPPNDGLECEGWRCACSLTPTTERRTPHALDRLIEIRLRSHL